MPQGSVLSVTLFSLKMNGLADVTTFMEVYISMTLFSVVGLGT